MILDMDRSFFFGQGQFAKMTLCQERSLYCSEAYRAADFPSR